MLARCSSYFRVIKKAVMSNKILKNLSIDTLAAKHCGSKLCEGYARGTCWWSHCPVYLTHRVCLRVSQNQYLKVTFTAKSKLTTKNKLWPSVFRYTKVRMFEFSIKTCCFFYFGVALFLRKKIKSVSLFSVC